ncbi:ubinuclein-2-like isoform X2 [Lineus longissimus]|uniref:ubinuclein-2-like isoform X2 n=1 Tax=Lineus longissimus TaxID=88925 RepID=UPI002B4D32FE
MAEPRIIHPVPMGPAGPKKKMEKVPKTLRFELTIQESTNLSCSEYSWLELLKKAADNDEDKLKECMDPFALQDLEEQKKLENIARSFESRYGNKISKKKRQVQIEDFVDLEDGYDDTDPFVDNSEAYDELVPATLTTKLGGFYINTGVLDFREVTGDSDGEFQSPKKKRKKKRVIASESDSDISAASSITKKKKLLLKKKRTDGEVIKKKRKKLVLSSGDEKPFVKKKKILKAKDMSAKKNGLNVADLIKQQVATPTEKKVITINGDNATTGINKGNDSINSTIDAVISRAVMESPIGEGRATPTSTPTLALNPENAPNPSSVVTPNPESAPPLPSGIPVPLEMIIHNIKESARASATTKNKFFNSAVNRMLLVIEKESRQLVCSQRSGIYNHLAAFLPCSKDTLLKRAKKLRLNEQDNKVRDPINRLKEAVNKVMPEYIEQYTQERKAAALAKNCEKGEGKEEGGSSDSDDDNTKEGKKKTAGPRKHFIWTDNIRELLCDVIRVKMMSYEMSKMRTQSAEEYLKTFLGTEIKPMWPKGWMQTRMLYKESKSTHAQWTVNAQKPKKNMIISGKITTSASNSPTPTTNTSVVAAGGQKQPTKSQKTTDNGLNSLMTLLDYAEVEHETGQKMEETDTADVLSSFLDSEAASEMLMCISDSHVPLTDIEEKGSQSSASAKQPKTIGSNSQSTSNSFYAQFQKFTGTYKGTEEAPKPPSVKTEPKKVVTPVHAGQGRDLKMQDGLMGHKASSVTSGQTSLGRALPHSSGIGLDLEQLSPPRAHYQSHSVPSTKTLQRSLSTESNTILGKKSPHNVSLGLGNKPKLPGHDSSVRNSGASNIRRQTIEPVKPTATSPLGLFPASPLSEVPKDNVVSLAAMYANAQAMASLAGMNSHLAGMGSHAMQQQKPLHNIMDFKLPQSTSDYASKSSEHLHQDSIGLSKQHQQFLHQVTSLAPSPAHLNSSGSSSLSSKPTSSSIWGLGTPSQPLYSTPSSRSGYNIPLSRISPTNSISTGMPAGYKSISLLAEQQKDSSLIHQGLQISRASTDPMRGAGSSYTHHSPGSSNHSPLGPGSASPHGHSPKGLYPPLAHNTSPRLAMPTSPFTGQYPTDKSRSPHGY